MKFILAAVLTVLSIPGLAEPPTCAKADAKNGSALCLSLRVAEGQVVVDQNRFEPNSEYQRVTLGDDFAAAAIKEITALPKVCFAAMSAEEQKSFLKAPANADPTTRKMCRFTGEWRAFVKEFLAWGESTGRADAAANALGENGVFRRLQTLDQRTPLLWIQDSNEGLDSEQGVIKLLVADRFDPRTESTLQIVIKGPADNAAVERRKAELRRWLNPLRGQVFCHERIRDEIRAYYKGQGVVPDIEQVNPAGALIVITETTKAP